MISRFLSCFLVAAGLFIFPAPNTQAAPAATATATATAGPASVFPTTPVQKPDGKRWRLGYVESGAYDQYPLTLTQIINGLNNLDWLTRKTDIRWKAHRVGIKWVSS